MVFNDDTTTEVQLFPGLDEWAVMHFPMDFGLTKINTHPNENPRAYIDYAVMPDNLSQSQRLRDTYGTYVNIS